MTNARYNTTYARVVWALCICMVCGILTAGLWPFHAPKNEVEWLKNENGLRFGKFGSILSSGRFPPDGPNGETACSIEIWLEPSVIDYDSTILAFDSSGDPRAPFSLRQHHDSLTVQRYMVDQRGTARRAWFQVEGVFREGVRTFLAITSTDGKTSVYVNGVPAGVSTTFSFSKADLTGHLIVADSTTHDNWPGQVLGLAIYRRQLTAEEIAQHYESWAKGQWPVVAHDATPVALYLFNEREGGIVHNQVDPVTNLIIPARYFVLHPAFLLPPWHEYRPGWSYWKDVGINIAGFIPFGLGLVIYFSTVRKSNRPAAFAIVLGFAVSLTIEVLQTFVSTRSSGMTDIFANTLGTALGAMLYHWTVVQGLLARTRRSAPFLEHQSALEVSDSIKIGTHV